MSDVVLTVNGKTYSGWTSVNISRGIEQISGAFELGFTDRWHGQNKPWPIRMGDACTVAVDGQTVITGHVDDVSHDFNASERRMACSGRDAAGDLVDCSAVNKVWKNRPLVKIASDIAAPFGMSVSSDVSTGAAIRHFGIEDGESAYEAIERLCRCRGVLPVSDGAGRIVITGPGTVRVKTALTQGENMLSASITRSMKDRYKTYAVKGHDVGSDDSLPEHNAGPTGHATDPNVSRYRHLVVLSEVPADSSTLKKRAMWEAAMRRGRSVRARVSVSGWRHADGIWTPNTLVKVVSDWLGLDAFLLITAVTYIRDDQGTRADLELSYKDGFVPETIPEKEEKA